MKAGNLGLNLACASRVFLFAPWFNPYVEEQAIARVDRLGQVSFFCSFVFFKILFLKYFVELFNEVEL